MLALAMLLFLLQFLLERLEVVLGEAHHLVEEAHALAAALDFVGPLAFLAIPGGDQGRQLGLVRLVLEAGPANYWRALVFRAGALTFPTGLRSTCTGALADGSLDDRVHLWPRFVEPLRWRLALPGHFSLADPGLWRCFAGDLIWLCYW